MKINHYFSNSAPFNWYFRSGAYHSHVNKVYTNNWNIHRKTFCIVVAWFLFCSKSAIAQMSGASFGLNAISCPDGTSLLEKSSQSCDPCPLGYSSIVGGSCYQCPAGTYSFPSSLSLSSTYSSIPSTGLQLFYRFDSVSRNIFDSGFSVGNIASGSVVYDATLQNGAVVSNNQLVLDATKSQYMSIGSFITGTEKWYFRFFLR